MLDSEHGDPPAPPPPTKSSVGTPDTESLPTELRLRNPLYGTPVGGHSAREGPSTGFDLRDTRYGTLCMGHPLRGPLYGTFVREHAARETPHGTLFFSGHPRSGAPLTGPHGGHALPWSGNGRRQALRTRWRGCRILRRHGQSGQMMLQLGRARPVHENLW